MPICQEAHSYFPKSEVISYTGGMDVVRKLILEKLDEIGLTMSEASLKIGRNHAYLQQFLKRGVPAELHERDRAELAGLLKVPEEKLKGSSPKLPKRDYARTDVSSRESLIDPAAHPPLKLDQAMQRIIPAADLFGGVDLPVFGTAEGGDGALVITDRPVDWVARPAVLLKVQDGYGMIVAGDSMHPAHRSGSTALVNPHLPPRVEDACIFRSHADDGTVHIMLKEYRGQTETHWKVRQYNPAKDFTLKKSEWQVCHVIVGSYFLR